MSDWTGRHDIAIVGSGAVLPPDGGGVASFQRLLESAKSAISEVPSDRWLLSDHFDPDPTAEDKSYTKIGGFVQGIEFKSHEFRIPPKVAQHIDRVQKWALLATREALREAGLLDRDFDRTRTAVLFGNSMGGEMVYRTAIRVHFNALERHLSGVSTFQKLPVEQQRSLLKELDSTLRSEMPTVTEDSMAGELANCIAGRVAGAFDLQGPSCAVDAACAGSVAAMYSAVHGLRSGSYDLAVVGGVDSNMGPESYVKFCKIGALSPDGSRPFDAGANGFVMGEGAAVFILKRLEDAKRDGDQIQAVICGVGASSDGKGKGITAPNPRGQASALRSAYADAGLRPRDVSYVECHGTSTPVGDVVEAKCLSELFAEDGVASGSVAIGSIKSQIGHLKGAAGAAGLLKVVLSLRNQVLYPSINVNALNPAVDFGTGALRVQTAQDEWSVASGGARRAGISAFGFGGTNYHLLVEEPGATDGRRTPVHTAVSVPVSAPVADRARAGLARDVSMVGAASLDALSGRLELLAKGGESADSAAVAAHRLAVLGQGADREKRVGLARKALELGADAKQWSGLSLRGVHYGSGQPGKLAFLYPGQGSQYLKMLQELIDVSPEVRATLEEADRIMTPLLGHTLTEVMFGEDEQALRRTEITQPALLTCDVALTRLLNAQGFYPDGTMGHSLGEYAALVCAGALRFEDALKAVSARGREMSRVTVEDPGKMASVFADSAAIDAALAPINAAGGYVICANRNSRVQTVIAGASDSVDQACDALTAQGVKVVKLPVSMAFHTQIVEPTQAPLERVLSQLKRSAPSIPVYKNLDGRPYPMGPGAADQLVPILGRQVGSPVEFVAGLEQMWADGFTHFVEVGPRKVLTGFVQDVLGDRGAVAIPTNLRRKGDKESFVAALAALKVAGFRPVAGPSAEDASGRSEAAKTKVVITGAALGLPRQKATEPSFDGENLERIFGGESLIRTFNEEERDILLAQNVERVKKDKSGGGRFELISHRDETVHLAGRAGRVDLVEDFGIDAGLVAAFDHATSLGIAAGLQALHDAFVPLVRTWRTTTTGSKLPTGWALPSEIGDETGIIFASAFPGVDTILEEVNAKKEQGESYRYPRNFLLRNLATAHGQFAQLVKARGPNTQINVACASTTAALALAEDWIRGGRCRRVVVVGADDITTDNMAEWFVTGFLAAGAATTEPDVTQAALPFDRRRHGMITGMGAVGLVLETEEAARERGVVPIAELVATEIANSAFHGTRLDTQHVADVMVRLVERATARLELSASEMGPRTIFMSHETYTPARGGSAQAEVNALRAAFGEEAADVLVANTKGFTGHPMGAGVEDAVVLKALQYGRVPPIANLSEPDPELMPLKLSDGGLHGREFALRLAAGFGSQIAMAVMRKIAHGDERIADHSTFEAWLSRQVGKQRPELVVSHNTLRVIDEERAHDAPLVVPDGPYRVLEMAPAPTAGTVDSEAAAPAPVLEGPVAREQAAAEILRLFSIRLGYPAEMLKLDLDLELDLGIDTLKQAEVIAEIRSVFDLGAAGDLQLKDYPTLRHVIDYVVLHSYGEAPAVKGAAPVPTGGELEKQVVALVAQRTGYPAEMLELDLDMEADLGIDTVKQAEIIGELRERYALPEEQELSLKDYPTLRHVVGYVASQRGGAATKPLADVASSTVVDVESAPAASASTPDGDALATDVIALVAARTGYPAEMLELDLDMEADLGIDTVKQAEIIGELRERYALPEDQELSLKDYPTLRHVVSYVGSQGAQAGSASPVSSPETAAPPSAAAIPAVPASTPTSAGPSGSAVSGGAELEQDVVALVAARTGYPAEMLELDLDMEADLGIDTVKQAEIIGELRERYALPEDQELSLKDYPTLRHVVGYVVAQSGSGAAPVATAPAVAETPPPVESGASNTGSTLSDEALEGAIVAMVAARTGYPAEMLELGLDMEADLGIDTVKQAEIMGELRETYALPENQELSLKDYPTLGHVVGYVRSSQGTTVSAPATTAPAPSPLSDSRPATARPAPKDITAEVVALVADRTGYPAEMLELDLDLESDLGIDTVKQAELIAELREQYGLPKDESLSLADYPTLRHVANYVQSTVPASEAPTVLEVSENVRGDWSEPAASTPASVETRPAASSADVTESVVRLVADRTGYPAEMLDLGLDMEADLGIDTVKQAEVLAELRENFGISDEVDLQLKDYPTLAHVVAFVQEQGTGGGQGVSSESSGSAGGAPAAEAQSSPALSSGEEVIAVVAAACGLPAQSVTLDVRPVLDLGLSLTALFPGVKVADTATLRDVVEQMSGGTMPASVPTPAPTPVAATAATPTESLDGVALRQLVWRHRSAAVQYGSTGCAPRSGDALLLMGDDSDTLEPIAEGLRRTGASVTVVPVPTEETTLPEARGLVYVDGSVQGLFLAVKALASSLQKAEGYVLALGDRQCAGVIKSLRREWPDAGLLKAVLRDEPYGPAETATLLLEELTYDGSTPVIRWAGGARWAEDLEHLSLDMAVPAAAPESVWVVSGGARGITAEIVRQVATEQGGTFYLLGRTRLSDPLPAPLPTEEADARRLVMEEWKAAGKTVRPAEVLSEVNRRRGQREIAAFVEELCGLPGVEASYHTADVVDAAALTRLMTEIVAKHGRIDVLVHAAGIEISRVVESKSLAEFERVLSPKLTGLSCLLDASKDANVGTIVTFGSVSGRFGNAGQTDYAAANEGLAERLSQLEGPRTLQIDWTAWGGVGMATRGSVTKMLEAAGIGFLPLAGGGLAFRRLLSNGIEGEVVVECGLGVMEPPALETQVPPTPLFFGDDAAGEATGRSVRFHWALESARTFLDDHRINGVPVLPGVMGLEAFGQAARALLPGTGVDAFEEVAFLLPLKLHGDRPVTATVEATALSPVNPGEPARVSCRLVSRFVDRHGNPQGPERVHFKATVVLTTAARSSELIRPNGTPMGAGDVDEGEIYQKMFHGQSFQVLRSAERYEGGLRAAVNGERLQSPTMDPASAPMELEALFQAVGLWQLLDDGAMGLPSEARSVQIHALPGRSETLECFVERNEESPGFEALLRDESGRVYLQISGYQTAMLPS